MEFDGNSTCMHLYRLTRRELLYVVLSLGATTSGRMGGAYIGRMGGPCPALPLCFPATTPCSAVLRSAAALRSICNTVFYPPITCAKRTWAATPKRCVAAAVHNLCTAGQCRLCCALQGIYSRGIAGWVYSRSDAWLELSECTALEAEAAGASSGATILGRCRSGF